MAPKPTRRDPVCFQLLSLKTGRPVRSNKGHGFFEGATAAVRTAFEICKMGLPDPRHNAVKQQLENIEWAVWIYTNMRDAREMPRAWRARLGALRRMTVGVKTRGGKAITLWHKLRW